MSATREFDVICVGAGPGGLATALWCADLGLSVLVVDREGKPGGQLNIIYNRITNYPGIVAEDGSELAHRFANQVAASHAVVRLESAVAGLHAEPLTVRVEGGLELTPAAVVVATGLRRRRLGIPGEIELAGKGILASGARSRDEVAGRTVIVIGGGDAAAENALILAEKAAHVTLVHRRGQLTAREEFVSQISESAKIELRLNTTVSTIVGKNKVEGAVARSNGTSETIPADSILVRIGWEPNTDLLAGLAELDEHGYVLTDSNCRTSIANVYAIGDVRRPLSPTICGAVGDAATVAKAISNELRTRRRP
jgi:thioredoxin reductase (NADPH)